MELLSKNFSAIGHFTFSSIWLLYSQKAPWKFVWKVQILQWEFITPGWLVLGWNNESSKNMCSICSPSKYMKLVCIPCVSLVYVLLDFIVWISSDTFKGSFWQLWNSQHAWTALGQFGDSQHSWVTYEHFGDTNALSPLWSLIHAAIIPFPIISPVSLSKGLSTILNWTWSLYWCEHSLSSFSALWRHFRDKSLHVVKIWCQI